MIGNIVYIREAQNREEFFVMKEKCCCVSGHRDIPADKLPYVKEEESWLKSGSVVVNQSQSVADKVLLTL